MIRYDPDSNSRIAKATHIVQVRLLRFQAGEWIEPPDYESEATAAPEVADEPEDENDDDESDSAVSQEESAPLEITLPVDRRLVEALVAPQRIWKGEQDGESIRERVIRFTQYRYRNLIRFKLPGVWSEVVLTPGADYIQLLSAPLAAFLEEPYCFFAASAVDVLRDIELADRSGCPPISFRALLDECITDLPTAGPLFLEYLASRIPETFFDRPVDFDAVFRQIENPAATPRLRWMWLRDIFGWLTLRDPAPPIYIARTVFGSLRLAQLNDRDLNGALLGVYLPNLLGLTSGLARKSASEAFERIPAARTSSMAILEANPQWPRQELLLDWLKR
jgi:hypothetical protein